MISINKHNVSPPDLSLSKVGLVKSAIEEIINNGEKTKSKDFVDHYNSEQIKDRLYQDQFDKCCFCERKIEKKYESDIEHFRPKTKVHDDREHPGYWWLAYKWENLFIACNNCNRDRKKNHFPLMPEGIRAYCREDELALEKPVLFDFLNENPEKFIEYAWRREPEPTVKIISHEEGWKQQRVEDAVEILGLNRRFLKEQRGQHLKYLNSLYEDYQEAVRANKPRLFQQCVKDIREAVSPQMPFSGFANYYFISKGLSDLFDEEPPS